MQTEHKLAPVTQQITAFFSDIDLEFSFTVISHDTFLPGLMIQQGQLMIDLQKLAHPGDMLHEAGHIAVTPANKRNTLGDNVAKHGHGPGEEMAAIAWSWAALKHLQLAAEVVFHSQGYRGNSENFIQAFTSNNAFGYPLLCYWNMCGWPETPGGYPKMQKWLR